MKNSSYSVLFMRDDADVKTLRVSPRRLRLLLWISLGLGLVVLIGLVVGLRSFVGYRSLLAERRGLEVQLAEAQVNLERLNNLDKLQKPTAPAAAGKGANADKSQPVGRAFTKIDVGTIAVENFRAQLTEDGVTTTFDLNNRAQGSSTGGITLLLLRSDGTLTELEVPNSNNLTYQIQRFKRISATGRAPAGLTRREALGLRVEIKNSDGEVILGETYALGN